MMETETLRASYRERGAGWEGVVRDAKGAVVAACGHQHRNRDQSTSMHVAAKDCAWTLLNGVTGDPGAAGKARGWNGTDDA